MKETELLVRNISDNSVVWFKNTNQYVIMNRIESEILLKVINRETKESIRQWCLSTIEISEKDVDLILNSINKLIKHLQMFEKKEIEIKADQKIKEPNHFKCTRYYSISQKIYKVEYESPDLEFLIHPKFAHLEVEASFSDKHFKVFSCKNVFVFKVDDDVKGKWEAKNFHFLTGKFSMELLNIAYCKTENDWMAVLHASAIGDHNNCILFAGDSGNGKSTASAILMANGFNLIADDFVPIDMESRIRHFPAALSVKKQALDILSQKFPELRKAKEIYFEQLKKTVRYLKPSEVNSSKAYPVQALVFIKYNPDVGFKLKRLENIEAFQKLIPDAWISPIKANASLFIEWLANVPSYQLTYSDNERLVTEINKLFSDE